MTNNFQIGEQPYSEHFSFLEFNAWWNVEWEECIVIFMLTFPALHYHCENSKLKHRSKAPPLPCRVMKWSGPAALCGPAQTSQKLVVVCNNICNNRIMPRNYWSGVCAVGHDADYIQIRPLFHQHSGSELLTITANTGKNCTFSILELDAS